MNETSNDAPMDEPRLPQPIFNLAGIVLALIVLQVAIYLVQAYVLSPDQNYWLIVHAAFVPGFYPSAASELGLYAATAPVTYSLLHGSLPHLVLNMVWLAAFGSPIANRIGALRFTAFWIVTALAAAALHYVLHSSELVPLVGASGAISGMMGAAARLGFRIDRSARRPAFAGPIMPVAMVLRNRSVVTFLLVWFAINLVTGIFGFMPGQTESIAWEAHVGGFIAGFFGLGVFDRRAGGGVGLQA